MCRRGHSREGSGEISGENLGGLRKCSIRSPPSVITCILFVFDLRFVGIVRMLSVALCFALFVLVCLMSFCVNECVVCRFVFFKFGCDFCLCV